MYMIVVGCLKITEDKLSKSRIQTPDAGLVIAISAAPRREGWNPRFDITARAKDAGVETRVSALLQCQDAESKARVSREAWRRAGNPRLSSITLAAKRKAQNLRLSCNCPHYWVNYYPCSKGVNPHYGVFLGDMFTPWNLYK